MIKVIIYLLSSITIFSIIAPGSAMGEINLFFQGENPTLIQLIVTITSLFVILGSFLSLFFCKRLGKKKTLLLSLVIYGFAGCAGSLISNLYLMLASRAVLGIAVGIFMPIIQSLPADFYSETERTEIIARQASSGALGNVISTTIGGFLVLSSWRCIFFIYAIALPLFIITYFCLPEIKYEEKNKLENKSKNNKNLPLSSYFISFSIFFYWLVIYAFYTVLAILMKLREIGTASDTASILAVGALFSFITSFNFSRLKRILGRFFIPSIYMMLTIGYVLVYIADSFFVAFLSGLFVSYTVGTTMPISTIAITNSVPREQVIRAMALFTSAMFLGQFLSPIVFNYLPALSNYTEYGSSFITLALVSFIVSTCSTLYLFSRKKEEN